MVRMLLCASNVTISASFATAAGAALSALAMAWASVSGPPVSTVAACATKGAVQASNANVSEARMTSSLGATKTRRSATKCRPAARPASNTNAHRQYLDTHSFAGPATDRTTYISIREPLPHEGERSHAIAAARPPGLPVRAVRGAALFWLLSSVFFFAGAAINGAIAHIMPGRDRD